MTRTMIKIINNLTKEFEEELSTLLSHGFEIINTGIESIKYNDESVEDSYWAILKIQTEETAQKAIK